MAWSTSAVRALIISTVVALGVTTTVAPAAAGPASGSERVTLVVGLGGAGASAALDRAGVEVVGVVEPIGVVEVEVPARAADAALRALERSPGIRFAEIEGIVEAGRTPTDTYWSSQWGARKVRAETAWDTTTGSTGAVIAVLDSGVKAGPEFDGKLLAGWDFVNDDSDATDDLGHGTSAAGVAAADANDGGIAGFCWTCRVLPVKVLDHEGSGGSSDVISGIVWAADQGADVINLSLGGEYTSTGVDNAVAYARSKGAVVIAAAGNAGVTTKNYPAAAPGVIAVAASDPNDNRYPWSNHGSWVDVAAPGCHEHAPTLTGDARFCGTSAATPNVAGIAGLAASLGASGASIEKALLSSAVPVGTWVTDGRVDAAATLAALTAEPQPAPQPAPEPDPEPQPEPEPEPEPAPAPAPEPEAETVTVSRASGDDRVATAVDIARHAFLETATASGADTVVIARSDSYADALAAAPLATREAGPVLLAPVDGLPASVATVVRDLGATRAILIGGTNALALAIEDQLTDLGVAEVRRIAGTNRFDTARQIAAEVGGSSAYLVEGVNADPDRGWPDAVAASALASFQGRPILLTASNSVPDETTAALRAMGATSVTIVGGTNAVSDAVYDSLSLLLNVTRIAGTSRYATSTALAEAARAAGADDGHVWVATGRTWPDALAAGPAAASLGAVLLLVDGTDIDLSPESRDWLASRVDLHDVVLVGGTASVSHTVETSISALGN